MYNDRGMKKWGGFILSDHKDQLIQPICQPVLLKEQSEQELFDQLQLALRYSAEVLVQLAILDMNGDAQQFKAYIEGIVDNRLVLKKDNVLKSYPLNMITRLVVVKKGKWYT